jgi:hypothetical protein
MATPSPETTKLEFYGMPLPAKQHLAVWGNHCASCDSSQEHVGSIPNFKAKMSLSRAPLFIPSTTRKLRLGIFPERSSRSNSNLRLHEPIDILLLTTSVCSDGRRYAFASSWTYNPRVVVKK